MFEASRIAFDPLVPWALVWTLVVFAAALWSVYLWRRGRAWLTRALALSVLALALMNPLWVREQREPLKDIVAVVLDRSESMNFRGRTETAEEAFKQLKAKIETDDTLELRIAETDPHADATELYATLQSALSDAPRERIGGAILITDGQIHDLPKDAKQAAQLGPVHGLIVGGKDEIDRRIDILSAPSFGIVDSKIEMKVQVDDPKATTVDVAVSINGDPQTPQQIKVGEPQTITFDMKKRGANLVVLQVPAIPNELTLANNLASVTISGVQDRLRVLLITGQPYAGERVWRDLLKSDPAVDLVHFTILRPLSKTQAAADEEMALIEFPRRTLFFDRLSEFDLVIFDHELSRNVLEPSYLDAVARYVEKGGALLVAAGPPYADAEILYNTPLSSVLPGRETGEVVERGDFVPQLTDLGKRHAVTATLPTDPAWGPWRRYMKLTGGDFETLMRAPDGSPLLLLKRVSEGRVASFMSDQVWFWARGYKGGGPYAELIRRVAHWLMKEPELEEELLTLSVNAQELKASLRTLKDTPDPLSIRRPDGQVAPATWTLVKPGEYVATLPAPQLGEYVGKAGKLQGVTVRGPEHPREYADLRATTFSLQPISTATKGGVFSIGDTGQPQMPDVRRVGEGGDAAGNNWLGLRKRGAYAVRATESITLIPGWLGMLVGVALLMLAWRREGR